MCGKNAIPRVGGRHQADHYTATKVAYLHGLYPLRRCVKIEEVREYRNPEVQSNAKVSNNKVSL
jgi:hypothetical protein